ncbi:hypothetical protein D3C80_1392050 [compost metagenome]
MVTNDFPEVIRPVDHRRQAGAGRQADPDGGDLVHMPPLDHRIGEMRGADHHGTDVCPVDARRLDHLFKGFDDT